MATMNCCLVAGPTGCMDYDFSFRLKRSFEINNPKFSNRIEASLPNQTEQNEKNPTVKSLRKKRVEKQPTISPNNITGMEETTQPLTDKDKNTSLPTKRLTVKRSNSHADLKWSKSDLNATDKGSYLGTHCDWLPLATSLDESMFVNLLNSAINNECTTKPSCGNKPILNLIAQKLDYYAIIEEECEKLQLLTLSPLSHKPTKKLETVNTNHPAIKSLSNPLSENREKNISDNVIPYTTCAINNILHEISNTDAKPVPRILKSCLAKSKNKPLPLPNPDKGDDDKDITGLAFQLADNSKQNEERPIVIVNDPSQDDANVLIRSASDSNLNDAPDNSTLSALNYERRPRSILHMNNLELIEATENDRKKKRVIFADDVGQNLYSIKIMAEASENPPEFLFSQVSHEKILAEIHRTSSDNLRGQTPSTTITSGNFLEMGTTGKITNKDNVFETFANKGLDTLNKVFRISGFPSTNDNNIGANKSSTTTISQNSCLDAREKICRWLPEFPMPIVNYQKYREKLDNNWIGLETIHIVYSDSMYNTTNRVPDYNMVGRVRVKNIAYEKQVFARVTYDGWKNFTDIPCLFAPPTNSLGPTTTTASTKSFALLYDEFVFEIRLATPTSTKVTTSNATNDVSNQASPYSIEFALCLRCQDSERWDNNNGANYKISLLSVTDTVHSDERQTRMQTNTTMYATEQSNREDSNSIRTISNKNNFESNAFF